MAGRKTAAPFTSNRLTVYLDSKTLQDVMVYAQQNDIPNESQAIAELVRLGLGNAPEAVAISGIRGRVSSQMQIYLRQRVGQMLTELAGEVARMSTNPADWRTPSAGSSCFGCGNPPNQCTCVARGT